MALFRFLKTDCLVALDPETGEVYWSLNRGEAILFWIAMVSILGSLGFLLHRYLA